MKGLARFLVVVLFFLRFFFGGGVLVFAKDTPKWVRLCVGVPLKPPRKGSSVPRVGKKESQSNKESGQLTPVRNLVTIHPYQSQVLSGAKSLH